MLKTDSPQRHRDLTEVHGEEETLSSLWTSVRSLCLCGESVFTAERWIRRQSLKVAALLLPLILLISVVETRAQKYGKPVGSDSKTSGPKIGKSIQPSDIKDKSPKTIIVKPTEGYLALSTTPQASVLLTLGKLKQSFQADAKGNLHIAKIKPGQYRVDIEHVDFESHDETLKILPGEPTVIIKPLTEKYGVLMLGLDAKTAEGVTIEVDGKPTVASQLLLEKEMIGVKRVPVGTHNIKLRKPGYLDWSRENFSVKPGDTPENLLTVDLERVSIALTISSSPGARVYVDNEARGVVASDSTLRVAGLSPGAHKLRLELFGYETAERPLSLTLDRREVAEEVRLESLIEQAEDKEDFDPKLMKWYPARPEGWQVEAGRGMSITTGATALFKRADYTGKRFNLYDDFTLFFRVKFTGGKGVAWMARAVDERNYYRFELTTSTSARGGKYFIASLCRDGVCRELSRDPVVAPIEKPDDVISIKLVAAGPKLEHSMSILSDPRPGGMQPLGRVITDDLFKKGGVGMCAVDGLDVYLSNFLIIPTAKAGN
jgi:hypothetical protein